MNPEVSDFVPPSDALVLKDGLWQPRDVSPVSYPEDGNDVSFQVEDHSYWFAHRNACLGEVMKPFPPGGTFFDIGGGNGFVTAAVEANAHKAVLIEPGSGARNARSRSLPNVIKATLEDCAFRPGSLPAAGAFDVVEHIDDDVAFLRHIHRLLVPGGRFYATVPAFGKLWSNEDDYAGHFRRYTRKSWREVIAAAGFEMEYVTCIFAWLSVPVLLMRSLPYRLRRSRKEGLGTLSAVNSDHRLRPLLAPVIRRFHEWELSRIRSHKVIPIGTSLLSVACKTP
jgi:SAM-dependent methyltransferase